MSRRMELAGRAGWAVLIALLVSPAVVPGLTLLTTAAELRGAAVPGWVLLGIVLAVGVVVSETYDGLEELLLPTALLSLVLFAALQWVAGLWDLQVVSMRVLAAEALVYLAAVAAAIVIVFQTRLRRRLEARLGGEHANTGSNADASVETETGASATD